MSDEPRTSEAVDAGFAPRLRDGVAFVPVADRAVLYVEDSGLLHRLDAIGATVCGLFDGATSIATVAGQLAVTFDSDRAVVEEDVIVFVRELAAAGLIDGVVPDEVRPEA